MGLTLNVYGVFSVVCLISVVSSIRILSISDARDEFLSREERASNAESARGQGIVFNDSMVFNASCILMETRNITIWARSPKDKDFVLYEKILNATYEVSGSCFEESFNSTAELTVHFTGNFNGNSNVTDAGFKMSFSRDVFNWHLTNLTLSVTYSANGNKTDIKDVELNTQELYASITASYYCKEPTITTFMSRLLPQDVATQYGLEFGEVIFQPFLNNTGDTFSPVEPCEYAFTIALWMAVFTGLIMTFIVFFGISMLSSIKTMDRFDDPKTSKLLSVPSE